jgi:acetyl esterase/lipase
MRALAALAFLAALPLGGCASFKLALANGADLINRGYRREPDLAYGPGAAQRLDVYVPAGRESGAPRTLIVFVHGGRWSSGSKEQYRFVAAGLAERGFVVVVPNYRLYPEVRMDAAADDVAHAVAWAEAAAAKHGADPARVVLMGHSAGAQLAALVANDPRWLDAAGARPVRALVGFAGPYDFLPLTDADLIDYFGPPSHYAATQPVNFVSRASPPAFLVYGLDDTSVKPRNIRSMAERLRAAGVPVEVRLLPGEDHGSVLKRCARFFRANDTEYAALLRFLLEPPALAPAA